MAQLRASVRAYLSLDPTPEIVLGKLHRMFAQLQIRDLVTLLYCSAEGGLGDDEQLKLWQLLRDRREAATLRAYLAHMSLRLSSWSAVYHDDATTERWLGHSQMWLDRAG